MKKKNDKIFFYIIAAIVFLSVAVRIYLVQQLNLLEIIHITRNLLFIVVILNYVKNTWKSIFINLFILLLLSLVTIIEIVLEMKLGKTVLQIMGLSIFFILIVFLLIMYIKKVLKEFCIEENVYILSRQKKYKSAILIYNQLIKKNPNRTDLIYSRGSLYDKIGKYKKAEKDFNRSINSENPDARGFIALGIYKYENEENEKALELLKKGIEMDSALKEYLPQSMKDIIK
ncbi:MAG: hypothetical protein PUC37_04480 [Spirochaetales bacterium]|nr:hypothetical protein [Spirochaetales bacterium]